MATSYDVESGYGARGNGESKPLAGSGTQSYIDQVEDSIRMGFIRKVYGILGFQLLTTFGIVALCIGSEANRVWIQEHDWIYWLSFGVCFGTLIFLSCFINKAREVPLNVCKG